MSNEVKVRFTGDDANLKKTAADVKRAVKGVSDEAKKQKSAVDMLRTSWGKLTGAMAALGAAYASLRVVRQSITDASDLGETVSKVGELFGDAKTQIEAWSMSAAKGFGQSRQQAMSAAADFAIFGSAAGLADRDLVNFSTTLTELASDLASFNNTTVDDAIVAVGAALRGESEPIRRYGVLLNEATLKQEAMRQGLIKTTTQALTPQQKVLASYQVILQQTTKAQGDFERTSEGLANQTKTLEAQLKDLSAEMGQRLLPAATGFVSYINDTAIPALIGAAQYTKEFTDAAGRLASALNLPAPPKGTTEVIKSAINPLAQYNALMAILSAKGREVQAAQQAAADAIANTGESGDGAAGGLGNLGGVLEDIRITTMNLMTEMNDLSVEQVRLFEDEGVALLHNSDLLSSQIRLQRASKDVADDAKTAAEAINLQKQKELDLELKLAQAKAAGNEEEAKRLEWLQKYNAATKDATGAGMNRSQAHEFAAAMANAGGGEAPEAPVTAGPPSSSGRPTLIAEASLQNFQRDPKNYFPQGHPRAGEMRPEALGAMRRLSRRSGEAQAREARRQERGFGGSRDSQQGGTGAAAQAAEEMFKASREADKQTQQAGDATSPGAQAEAQQQTSEQHIAKIRELVESIEKKVPEGTT